MSGTVNLTISLAIVGIIVIIDYMAPKKIVRMPYTPLALKPEWTNQTIRLAVRDNNRLKRAAKRKKMTFNAWAVMILMDAADRTLNRPSPVTITPTIEGEPIGEASE